MREERFSRWDDFRAYVDQMRGESPAYWRGQVDKDWPLSSSFDRAILQFLGRTEALDQPMASGDADVQSGENVLPPGFVAETRDLYLKEFKAAASGLRGPNPALLDVNQWWALGRHYGLISPLLDWTEKPYIAAFFAMTPWRNHLPPLTDSLLRKEAAVYRLVNAEGLEGKGLHVLRLEVDEVPRLQDQRGIFTLLDSEVYFDLRTFLEDTGHGHLLTRITLTGDALMEGLLDLDDHGIDYRSLFPDLAGAAMHANVMLQRSALKDLKGLIGGTEGSRSTKGREDSPSR